MYRSRDWPQGGTVHGEIGSRKAPFFMLSVRSLHSPYLHSSLAIALAIEGSSRTQEWKRCQGRRKTSTSKRKSVTSAR